MGVYIIAELGDNHNGKPEYAFQLVDKAVEAGVDCVKFQVFKTEEIISFKAEKAEYQIANTGNDENQFEMVKKLELGFDVYVKLYEYCKKKNIDFLATAFDLPSADFLDHLGMPFWKIPSGEITNLPLLIRIAKSNKPIIMSTGMCTMEEIKTAIHVLKTHGAGIIRLLHCNTEYPTPYKDVNLRAMATMRETFGVEVGYSDHTSGIEVPIAAVAMGAAIIEKHFTLDKNMEGPDHKASLTPNELKAMVQAIRNTECALGDSVKKPSPSESKNITIARKSIVARRPIKAGEIFTEENLAVKRPGNGLSPMMWFEVLGQVSQSDYELDEMIRFDSDK